MTTERVRAASGLAGLGGQAQKEEGLVGVIATGERSSKELFDQIICLLFGTSTWLP